MRQKGGVNQVPYLEPKDSRKAKSWTDRCQDILPEVASRHCDPSSCCKTPKSDDSRGAPHSRLTKAVSHPHGPVPTQAVSQIRAEDYDVTKKHQAQQLKCEIYEAGYL